MGVHPLSQEAGDSIENGTVVQQRRSLGPDRTHRDGSGDHAAPGSVG